MIQTYSLDDNNADSIKLVEQTLQRDAKECEGYFVDSVRVWSV